jgi:hypothetical protein
MARRNPRRVAPADSLRDAAEQRRRQEAGQGPAPKNRLGPGVPTAATTQGFDAAQLAASVESEIRNSVFCQLLLRRAYVQARIARDQLCIVNVTDVEKIMALQNEVRRNDDISRWIRETYEIGDNAIRALEEQHGITYAEDQPEAF